MEMKATAAGRSLRQSEVYQFNRDNKVTMVRWRFVPQDGEKQLSDAEQKSMPRDFLEKAFIDRTHRGLVRWDMMVTIGQPGDSEDDPTILWPNDRKEVRAGTLTLSSAMPDPKAGSYKIKFGPLMMADGIEATNDPILLLPIRRSVVVFLRRDVVPHVAAHETHQQFQKSFA